MPRATSSPDAGTTFAVSPESTGGWLVDYVIVSVSAELGMQISAKAFFGLLVAVWYLLNELLSIIENAGRMGANVPEWLRSYIAVLKDKIDNTDYRGDSKA